MVDMKLSFCILASVCLLANGAHLSKQTTDQKFATMQKKIYELFWHVDQPTVYHPELKETADKFKLEENVGNFNDKDAVHEFMEMMKHGMLPRGHVFSSMNKEMYHQAVVLYRLFYSAKNWDTFYSMATWARFHVNEYMYVYCLSVAVIQRPDMQHMRIPPLYETMPHFFFNSDVMKKAYSIAMGDTAMGKSKTTTSGNYYLIMANYSGWYEAKEHMSEMRMTYFTEDIGLNAFYFMMSHENPTFMNSTTSLQYTMFRGEEYLFAHKQLLNRYYMERLSNDLGEMEYISLDRPIKTGYYPTMMFRNGMRFPQRETDAFVPVSMMNYMQKIKQYHNRISMAIDLGFAYQKDGQMVNIYTPKGLNMLGNMIQGNADSVNPRYYGHMDALVRKVFGFGHESHTDMFKTIPSALEIYCTSMRDPVFYSMYKNILDYYHRYKMNLPKYTEEEISFPGVSIESVTTDKLITYFDTFESMLSNGMSVPSHKDAMMIKARQYRLNHKPYTVHMTVKSDKPTKAMVRMFLGPKYDQFGHEFQFEMNYMHFMELDEWVVDLKAGSNEINRHSHESIYVVPDETPSEVFYKNLLTTVEGKQPLSYSEQLYGFPDRLLLPKGKKGGMTFKLFVTVSPFDETKSTRVVSPVWGPVTVDSRPLGFPLDRPVYHHYLTVPNMHMMDVVIEHKQMEELNVLA